MPKVSVVMPTYNRAHLLNRSIPSVLNQTYKDFEYIVVDDASTDNTEQVVKGFRDDRLRYIRREKNSGSCAAPRNTGIRAARGEYIAHLDDDSEWLPQKLEKQVKAFETAPPKVGAVYTGMWVVVDDKDKLYLPPSDVAQKEGNIYRQLLKQCFVWNNQVVMIRKECFDKLGMFDEKLPFWLEWDICLRVARDYDFKFIDEPLMIHHHSPNTSHYSELAIIKGTIAILDKFFEEFKKDDIRLLAERYFNAGAGLCIDDDPTEFLPGKKCIWKAAALRPWQIKYLFVGLASLSGPSLFHNGPLRRLYRRFSKTELKVV